MITRLDRLQGRDIYENTALAKINELVDAVNGLHGHIKFLDERIRTKNFMVDVDKTNPISKYIDIEDPYAEQRKWRGKLCRFWDDGDEPENCAYGILVNIFDLHHEDCPFQCEDGYWYEYCEPVKPDDDIIYKGGDNE